MKRVRQGPPSCRPAAPPDPRPLAGAGRTPVLNFRIALHEAGHAVVGRALGSEIAGATIIPSGGHMGQVWGKGHNPYKLKVPGETEKLGEILKYWMPETGAARAEAEGAPILLRSQAAAIELLAGTESERLLFDAEPPFAAEHDVREARVFAAIFCCSPQSIDLFIAYARMEAAALIDANKNAVLAVAAALVEKGTLDGTEIDSAIAAGVALGGLIADQSRRAEWLQTLANAKTFEACDE